MTCGFAKIAMHEIQHQCHGLKHHPCEIATVFKARIFQWQHHRFQRLFNDNASSFNIPYNIFRKQLPKIKEIMVKLGKRHGEKNKQLINGFSSNIWKTLSLDKKNTYSNCFGCRNDPKFESLHGLFPSKNLGNIKTKQNSSEKEINCPTSSTNNLQTNSVSNHILQTLMQPTSQKKALQKITKEIFNDANMKLLETFPGLNIFDVATVVPKFNLEKKKTKVEKQRQKRKIYRDCKEDIESQRLETAIERTYGSDISLRKRQKIRLSESFERSEEYSKGTSYKK